MGDRVLFCVRPSMYTYLCSIWSSSVVNHPLLPSHSLLLSYHLVVTLMLLRQYYLGNAIVKIHIETLVISISWQQKQYSIVLVINLSITQR